MIASDIATRAGYVLNDPGSTRWTTTELLAWITDAQREIVEAKPSANPVLGNIVLAPNTTRQAMPTGSFQLFDIYKNMGAGTTPGKAIRSSTRDALDAENPDWHTDPAGTYIKLYMYDIRIPNTFWVYPQPASAMAVEASWSAVPAAVANLTDTLALNDVYLNVICDYVLYRSYAKESEYGSAAKAVAYKQAFEEAIGVRKKVETADNPIFQSPQNPNAPIQARGALEA